MAVIGLTFDSTMLTSNRKTPWGVAEETLCSSGVLNTRKGLVVRRGRDIIIHCCHTKTVLLPAFTRCGGIISQITKQKTTQTGSTSTEWDYKTMTETGRLRGNLVCMLPQPSGSFDLVSTPLACVSDSSSTAFVITPTASGLYRVAGGAVRK